MKELTSKQKEELLGVLKTRFEKNMNRHKNISWNKVQARLDLKKEKLRSLNAMEITGGEPDVVGQDNKTGEYIFFDCSAESPKERRSLCYDRAAWESRKEHKPKNTVIDVATEMGIDVLTEEQYKELQNFGIFDAKTSSWLHTPADVRKLGGGISGEFRFGRTFIYANGAESYFGSRGFRGLLRI
ncbi:MAG: DUF4256 domain-containing protein [Bacteroidetes bacterium]|nr:DUF4256 domain-containing protein [Bacteroidota bacterium]MBS1931937.1 DUF4256 domain-containing protein [Bacteroidota bacterium]